MSEIKVGEYVRTNNGLIGKVNKIETKGSGTRFSGEYLSEEIIQFNDSRIYERRVKSKDIVNHSKDIIDLIEVGDYVNEYKALEIADSIYPNSKRVLIYKNEKEKYERWIYIQEYDGKIHTQDDIVSIATKEQFKNIEYKVGE